MIRVIRAIRGLFDEVTNLVQSIRGPDGAGVTISYWDSAESIENWHAHAEHKIAQAKGRSTWYARFKLRVCRVEREYEFVAGRKLMRQIEPHLLWLGHAGDGRDFKAVLDQGIQAVVQLAVEEPPLQLPRELIFTRFPIVDSPGNDPKILGLAILTIVNLLEKKIPTLVCCGAGMSRSPAIAAAALAMLYQETPETCLKQVAEHHPADVAPGLWKDVIDLVGPELTEQRP